MTVDDDDNATEPAPAPRPVRRRRGRSRAVGNAVAGAFLALAVLFALGVVATYFMRDRTANSSGMETVTVTPSAKAGGADGRFFSALASYGISDNGNESMRQRYLEFGHHVCFSLLPPRPQTLDSTIDDVMNTENKDASSGNPWAPPFTRDDAARVARAAVDAYCPTVPR